MKDAKFAIARDEQLGVAPYPPMVPEQHELDAQDMSNKNPLNFTLSQSLLVNQTL